jgi:peptidoglycan biosynthesis protein MviN/MurJ (putative lipid II flippase)
MLVRAFIARKDTLTPTAIGLVTLSVTIGLSLMLMGRIETSEQSSQIVLALASLQAWLLTISPIEMTLGHVGLALASSISAACSLLLIMIIFQRKIGSFPWRDFITATLKSTCATGGMIAAITACKSLGLTPAAQCSCGAIIGFLSYCVLAWLLRSREMLEAVVAVRTRVLMPR